MVTPICRVSLFASVIALGMATASNAAPIFNVTDLGTSYSFTKDSTGYTTAVTSGDGSQSYTFDKYPVNYFYTSTSQQTPAFPPDAEDLVSTGFGHEEKLIAMSNKYGSFTIDIEQYGNAPPGGGTVADVSTTLGGSWFMNGFRSPLSDFNIHGQVVGTQNGGSAVSSVYGFLSNDISSKLGIYLTNALYIDDQGQIIAVGGPIIPNLPNDQISEVHYYLLTPNGSPTPAPEPSTLAVLAVGITALGIRAAHRRRTSDRLYQRT